MMKFKIHCTGPRVIKSRAVLIIDAVLAAGFKIVKSGWIGYWGKHWYVLYLNI